MRAPDALPSHNHKPPDLVTRIVRGALLGAIAFITAGRPVTAACNELGGFAIYQCAELAYFAPPPNFDPNLYFVTPGDPGAGLKNVTATFWQIGFGNNDLNTGLGSTGTGNSSFSVFNGNDHGLAAVDIAEARSATENASIPEGAFCLRNNNWGNQGIDGCCDNDRGTTLPFNNDDLLNPLYDVYYARNGYSGQYSLAWQQDYPMAVLLQESSGQYFALAAISTMDRGNSGGAANGPCAGEPGTNEAACDARRGSYSFAAIKNGLANAASSGASNVIPWQVVPQIQFDQISLRDPGDPSSGHVVSIEWPPVTLYSDLSTHPSAHPQMGPADPNSSAGVGVLDVDSKFPLTRFVVEVAAATDPNFAYPSTSVESTAVSLSTVIVPSHYCIRLRTVFGKRPQSAAGSIPNCRLGKCGDIGYEVSSATVCLDVNGGSYTRSTVPRQAAVQSSNFEGVLGFVGLASSEAATSTFAASTVESAPTSSTTPALDLVVSHGINAGDVVLSWVGGVPPYNAYGGTASGIGPLLENTSAASVAVNVSGSASFGTFLVGDQQAPAIQITGPTGSTHTEQSSIVVSGIVPDGVTAVFVNNVLGGVVPQLGGWTFNAGPVPLALGANVLDVYGWGPGNPNPGHTQETIVRDPSNDPPTIAITSPLTNDQTDVTPVISVVYGDADGPIDPNSDLHIYVDGTERTEDFDVHQPPVATWQVPPINHLDLGQHVVLATIKDSDGFTQSASRVFRVIGPTISTIVSTTSQDNMAAPGESIDINGSGFGTGPNETHAYFDGTEAPITSVTTSKIKLNVPTFAQNGPLTVEVDGIASKAVDFDEGKSFIPASAGSELAIDASDRYYYDDSLGQVITRVNKDGSGSTVFFRGTDAAAQVGSAVPLEILDFKFDPARDTLWVVTRGGPTWPTNTMTAMTGYIFSVNSSGGRTLEFVLGQSSGFSDPSAIDVSLLSPTSGLIFATAIIPDVSQSPALQALVVLHRGTPVVDTLFALPSGVLLAPSLALDSTGAIAYFMHEDPTIFPLQFRLYYYITNLQAGGPLFFLGGNGGKIVTDCADTTYFTAHATGEVFKFQGVGSTILIASGLAAPYGLDINSKGRLFITDESFGVRYTKYQSGECSSDFAGSMSGDAATVTAHSNVIDPNDQFVVLTACLSRNTIKTSGSKVYWTFEDVDDPATDVEIDPNGPLGDDNLALPPPQPFRAVSSTYPLTIGSQGPHQYGTPYDAGKCSRIEFHYSDGPGDNFRVAAEVSTGIGTRTIKSKVMTVWRNVNIELDSMGWFTGVPDVSGDDAVIGDVPDPPATSLVTNALATAYLNAVYWGHGLRTDATFVHHLPSNFRPSAPADQFHDQGISVRDSVSSSVRWALYLQGAYENAEDRDNDPDPGQPPESLAVLGATISREPGVGCGRYAFLYTETIRDVTVDPNRPVSDEAYRLQAVELHEFGHEFGLTDGPCKHVQIPCPPEALGIMDDDGFPRFQGNELRAIRDAARSCNGYPSGVE